MHPAITSFLISRRKKNSSFCYVTCFGAAVPNENSLTTLSVGICDILRPYLHRVVLLAH